MEWKTLHCNRCNWEGNEGKLVLYNRLHTNDKFGSYVCPKCLTSDNLFEEGDLHITNILKRFSNNMEAILKDMEEKEKKREISKIINSLQTPFTQVMNMIGQEVSDSPGTGGTKFTIKF